MRTAESKLVPFERLSELAEALHGSGKSIVTTNGCFDLLHLGHIYCLEVAKKYGDVLVVAVNSDASVKQQGKGTARPIQNEKTRALQIAALESVDYVTVFSDLAPLSFVKTFRPHTHIKGGDYDQREIPETEIVEEGGGKVVFVPLLAGFSTSDLIEKLKLLPDEKA